MICKKTFQPATQNVNEQIRKTNKTSQVMRVHRKR